MLDGAITSGVVTTNPGKTIKQTGFAPADDDEEIIVSPSLSVEEVVAQRVRDAEARGEVLELDSSTFLIQAR